MVLVYSAMGMRTLISLGTLVLIGAAIFFARNYSSGGTSNSLYAHLGGDFVLDTHDRKVSLQEYRGKFVFLYFGYTFCPDVCPTSLTNISAMLRQMSPEELDQVVVWFVSVDPDRDKLDRLKEYVSFFHPKIIGLTGSESELKRIVSMYGAQFQKQKSKKNLNEYSVDHSARIYLIGPQGKILDVIAHGTPPNEMLTVLRARMK